MRRHAHRAEKNGRGVEKARLARPTQRPSGIDPDQEDDEHDDDDDAGEGEGVGESSVIHDERQVCVVRVVAEKQNHAEQQQRYVRAATTTIIVNGNNGHVKSSKERLPSTSCSSTSSSTSSLTMAPLSTLPPPVSATEMRTRLAAIRKWFDEFSDAQKTLAFDAILPSLSRSQLHRLAERLPASDLHVLCPDNCTDFLASLPPHVARKIILCLEPLAIVRASRVCKSWYRLMESDWIWRRLAFLPPWRLGPAESQEQIELKKCSSVPLPFSSPSDPAFCSSLSPSPSAWKRIFRERFKLRRCWLRGQCHVRTFEGHTGAISCVQFDANRIVSGAHDNTIRVWNIKTNSPLTVMTLTGHSGAVRCLHLEGNRLVSGSTDMTIKVWDLDIQPEWSSIGCKVTMVGHGDTVRCVEMRADRGEVISGSYDRSLRVWSLRSGECLRTLEGHAGRVLCLCSNEDQLLSGSADQTIRLWSVSSGACERTLRGHSDAVTCLSREGSKVVSGSLDRTIKVWDIDTADCISTLDWMSSEGHTGVIRCLQADRWRIVSAADDKTIKVWCLESGQRLVTLRSHSDGVTCLRFNDFVIVSGSYDKTVKLWDFTVC